MPQFSYRLHLLPLALLFGFTHVYGATVFDVSLSTSQSSNFIEYGSGTSTQTSRVLKAKLEGLTRHQKPLNDEDAINTNRYDSKSNEVFKALVYKK